MEIVFGSVLGFLATLASGTFANYRQLVSQRRSYNAYLGLEFGQAVKSLDALRAAYERQSFYDFLLIDLLDKVVENLQVARQSSYLIKDSQLQERVLDAGSRIATVATDMRATQQYSDKRKTVDADTGLERVMNKEELADQEKFVGDRRSRHMMEILDLKREVKDLQSHLK